MKTKLFALAMLFLVWGPVCAQASPQSGKTTPRAHSQPEYDAYKRAIALTDVDALVKAANNFASAFPDSELREVIYKAAMEAAQKVNRLDEMINMGRKVLAYDSDDPEALLNVALVLTARTRDTDVDSQQKWLEAKGDAQRALITIDTDVDSDGPQGKVDTYKAFLRSEAYAVIGVIESNEESFAKAECDFERSITAYPSDVDPVVVLRLAITLDRQSRYGEALDQANRAVELAGSGSSVKNAARMEQERLTDLIGGMASPYQPSSACSGMPPSTSSVAATAAPPSTQGNAQSIGATPANATVDTTDYAAKLKAAHELSFPNLDLPQRVGAIAPHSYALVIGVEKYDSIPSVPYAAHDAYSFQQYLQKTLGVPEGNIRSYPNPTTSQLHAGVRWLSNQAKSDNSAETRLFLYYAGHGLPDVKTHKPYLLGVDADPTYIADTAYSLDDITKELEITGAEAIVILDACFSGTAARDRSGKGLISGARPAYLDVHMPGSRRVVVFSASMSDQTSNALDAAQHGLFTYYMLSGLQGNATDSQGRITIASLYAYVRRQVSNTADRLNFMQVPSLTPSIEELGPTANLPLEHSK